MLYQLVLVDDEDWILSGIQNAIEWEEIGFEIAGAYTNGRDAVKAMLENPPDAVLTDIKMPIQDGISMARELREAGLEEIEIVFLSGYDDFELAQSSMRLGAVDYVLKPSAPEQIIEVFVRIREKLDARRKKAEERRADSELVQAGIRVFKQAVFNSITEGNRTVYNRLMTLYEEFAEREKGRCYVAAAAALEGSVVEQMPDRSAAQGVQALKAQAKKLKADWGKEMELIENQFSVSFYLPDCTAKEAEELMESFRRRLRREAGCRLTWGISGEYQDFSQIWEACETSFARLFSLKLSSDGRMLYQRLGNDDVLKAAAEDRDQQIILWSLKNWFAQIDRAEEWEQRRLTRRMVYGLGMLFLENGMEETQIASLYQILEEESCEKIRKRIISFVQAEFLPEKRENSRNANLCREAAKYISKNYAEEITLADLAERFYISANYLGTLFRKNMGMGIKEYQTAVRLEQADVLISSGKFKLYRVAEMVGYPNYEYFRKTYQKYRGRNPSE